MKFGNAMVTKAHVHALRAHEEKILDAATLLYVNLKSTWNSVITWSLKRMCVLFGFMTKQKKTALLSLDAV